MSSAGDADRMTKNQRREAAREKAREIRLAQKRRERRRKVLLQGGIIVAAVAVIAIIALVLVNSVRPAGPGPQNMASDGIVLTSTTKADRTPALAAGETPPPTPQATGGAIQVVIYEDYLCPYCNQFEQTNATQIGTWLDSGYITYEIHPIGLLDRNSLGSRYSSRSANAGACVAQNSPDDFWAFNGAMYANQPEESTSGLTNAQIIGVIKGAGVKNMGAITKCVNNEQFKNWVSNETARAINIGLPGSKMTGVQGTPTVVVNGQQYSGSVTDADAFAAFVVQQSGQQFNDSASPTPTPTPSP